MKKLILAVLMVAATAQAVSAQVNPGWTTTLSVAINSTQTTITLAATSATPPGTTFAVAAGDGIYADGEYMTVASTYRSGTQIPVLRGQLGTVAKAHVASLTVVVARPGA